MINRIISILIIGCFICVTFPQTAAARWHDQSDQLPGMMDDSTVMALAAVGGAIALTGASYLIYYFVKKNKTNDFAAAMLPRKSGFTSGAHIAANLVNSLAFPGMQPASLYQFGPASLSAGSAPIINPSFQGPDLAEDAGKDLYLVSFTLRF